MISKYEERLHNKRADTVRKKAYEKDAKSKGFKNNDEYSSHLMQNIKDHAMKEHENPYWEKK